MTATSQSWPQRNWRWLLPAAILGVILLAAGLALLVLTIIMEPVKSSDAYHDALQRAGTDSRVTDLIGRPIEPKWFVTGRIEHVGPRGGFADMTIPIRGPRGDANLYVIAREHQGQWLITKLVLNPTDAASRIDLLAPSGP